MSKSDLSTVRLADPVLDGDLLQAIDSFHQNRNAAPALSVVGEEPVLDEKLDEADELNPNKINTADLIMASSFNDFASPTGFSLANHNKIRNADKYADYSISQGGGRVTEVNGIAYVNGKAIDDDEENDEALESFKDQVDELNEKLWDQKSVTIGGVSMSGEEWDQVHEALTNPVKRRQIQEALMREKGWDEKRSKKAIDDALILAQIAQEEKNGTITPARRAQADQIARDNPDAVTALKTANDYSKGMDNDNNPSNSQSENTIELGKDGLERQTALDEIYSRQQTSIRFDTDVAIQTNSILSAINPRTPISSFPTNERMSDIPLTASFNASTQNIATPLPAPLQVAAVAPQPTYDMNAGMI